jgi:hypothetical protein
MDDNLLHDMGISRSEVPGSAYGLSPDRRNDEDPLA